jgi:hypothetical protein
LLYLDKLLLKILKNLEQIDEELISFIHQNNLIKVGDVI